MQTQVVFLLFPKVHLQDLSGPCQVFYEANGLGKGDFEVTFVSPYREVRSEQGLLFSDLKPLGGTALRKGDLICIPGFDYASFIAGELDDAIELTRSWLWSQYRSGVCLSSICSGAAALGKLGFLDGVSYTSHWKCLEYMKTAFPKANQLKNRLYVMDKGIFTSAGMTSGIDMALAIVEQWRNPLLSAKIAREMVINVRRAETRSQENIFLDFKNHFNADVYKAQEILAGNLSAEFTIEKLAMELNMTVRHLSRLFRSHTGDTIHAYREKLRLEFGERLLLNSRMSVKEVADKCGFASSRQFTRMWSKCHGIPPTAFRDRQISQRLPA